MMSELVAHGQVKTLGRLSETTSAPNRFMTTGLTSLCGFTRRVWSSSEILGAIGPHTFQALS
jgi:hypothetical protein